MSVSKTYNDREEGDIGEAVMLSACGVASVENERLMKIGKSDIHNRRLEDSMIAVYSVQGEGNSMKDTNNLE